MAFQVMAAGCGGFIHHALTAPAHCSAAPSVVGLLMFRRPGGRRAVWLGFACDRHADQLLAARPLLPRDHDVLARRRTRSALNSPGAVGRASRRARSRAVSRLIGSSSGRWPGPLRTHGPVAGLLGPREMSASRATVGQWRSRRRTLLAFQRATFVCLWRSSPRCGGRRSGGVASRVSAASRTGTPAASR